MTSPDPGDDDPDVILRNWYDNHYSTVAATGRGSVFHRYMHRAMERRFGIGLAFSRVLEVGGNRGEHIPFVRHQYDEYVLTDLHPPQVDTALAADTRRRTESCDVLDMPYASGSFDRLIATCLLHHVDSPLRAAQEMRRVTREDGGVVTILVPTDPGLAYRAARALTSGRAARRHGVFELHRLVSALDHRNHFGSIDAQVRHVFRRDELAVDWMPWRLPSFTINAFVVFNATLRPRA